MFTSNRIGIKTYNLKQNKTMKWKNAHTKERTIISEIFCDYLTHSTIHGISYLGAKDKNWIEKTWWIIGFILSVTTCTYFIHKTWTKWTENPVIITFAQDHTTIWDIPFPAVTVCPLNKVRQNQFNFTAYFLSYYNDNKTSEEKALWNDTEIYKKLSDISFICKTEIFSIIADNITDENIITNIKMVAPSLIYAIGRSSTWKNDLIETEDYFAHKTTAEGLCFTFNALGYEDMYTEQMKGREHFIDYNRSSTGWSMEDGYSRTNTDTSFTDYPLRTSQSGLVYGLYMDLWSDIRERTQYCGEDVGGYKMVLHNPAEIPRLSENYFLIPGDQKVIVAITPKVIRTSKNLINIDAKTRNCYFGHERKLRFFKVYTQYNCKTECLANITRQHCGCTPFYLPRDNKSEICGFGRLDCLLHANDLEFKYSNLMKDSDRVIEEYDKDEFAIYIKCNCLASCDYLDYQAELSQAENLFSKLYHTADENKQAHIEKTPINIFFKESQFLALERNELYGQTDFIANVGGLLGLFMGFSFLSLLEIVYYVTLRVWCKIYHKYRIDFIPEPQAKIVWIN